MEKNEERRREQEKHWVLSSPILRCQLCSTTALTSTT